MQVFFSASSFHSFDVIQNNRLSFVDCAVVDDAMHNPQVEKCLLEYAFITKLPFEGGEEEE